MEKQNNKERVSEKALTRMLITSAIAIFICIVCLCSTTWAWFSDTSMNTNTIRTADECKLTVTASDGTQELMTADTATPKTLTLEQGVTYTVTLTLPRDSASGCLVMKTDSGAYYSDYIERHDSAEPRVISFTVTPKDGVTALSVTFTPRWGIYSGECNVKDGGSLVIE